MKQTNEVVAVAHKLIHREDEATLNKQLDMM